MSFPRFGDPNKRHIVSDIYRLPYSIVLYCILCSEVQKHTFAKYIANELYYIEYKVPRETNLLCDYRCVSKGENESRNKKV